MNETKVYTNASNETVLQITTPVQRGTEMGRRPGHRVEMEYTSFYVVEIYYPEWAPNTIRISWRRYFNGVIVNDMACGGMDNVARQYEYVLGEKLDPAILAPLQGAHAAAA